MRDRRNDGLWAWKQRENNNRLIAFQGRRAPETPDTDAIRLAYFGGSCFRLTTPAGVTLMIDPWRNPPWGNWDWFLYDFPDCEVDIGLSTHAHFDHDNLHSLRASTLLDRLVGRFELADAVVTGIADKHATDTRHTAYDWVALTQKLTPISALPPDNWRSFDNSLLLIETAGLRILHWGDNRADPPEEVWSRLGQIDILLLPVDGSFHVLSEDHIAQVRERLAPSITIPHHYFIWNVTHQASTLLPPDDWLHRQANAAFTGAGEVTLTREDVKAAQDRVLCFGQKVAFDPAEELSRKARQEERG
ncbi:MAG: MBL fold metallo-hydrolase [Rhodobacteraceae bacterium]|nr:MBL fold metallo-hydrolase [Paracoccaceae bacterium]